MIYLIRHGESLANAGFRTSDPALIELTALGKQQAETIAQTFESALDLIVSSCYVRTKQTAQPTLRRFPHIAHEEWPIHEFTYICPSRCQQTTAQERQPLVAEYWQRCEPSFIDGPYAESWEQLLERARLTSEKMYDRRTQHIALFSHGQFIKMLLAIMLGQPLERDSESMRHWRDWALQAPISNGQIIRLTYEKNIGWRE